MKEMNIKLNVMLSDQDYDLMVKSVENCGVDGWTINDELKMLARKGITQAITERREKK